VLHFHFFNYLFSFCDKKDKTNSNLSKCFNSYSQVSQKIKIKIIFGLKNKIHGVFYYFYTELKKNIFACILDLNYFIEFMRI